MRKILAVLAAVGLLVGCENDNSSSVVNEAPETVVVVGTEMAVKEDRVSL